MDSDANGRRMHRLEKPIPNGREAFSVTLKLFLKLEVNWNWIAINAPLRWQQHVAIELANRLQHSYPWKLACWIITDKIMDYNGKLKRSIAGDQSVTWW